MISNKTYMDKNGVHFNDYVVLERFLLPNLLSGEDWSRLMTMICLKRQVEG